jgi:hypothetical protein
VTHRARPSRLTELRPPTAQVVHALLYDRPDAYVAYVDALKGWAHAVNPKLHKQTVRFR